MHIVGYEPIVRCGFAANTRADRSGQAREGSQVAIANDEQHGHGEIVLLGGAIENRRSRIRSTAAEQFDDQQQVCLDINRHIHPALLAVDPDRGLIDRDLRQHSRQQVAPTVARPFIPLPHRLIRLINVEQSQNRRCLPERKDYCVEADTNALTDAVFAPAATLKRLRSTSSQAGLEATWTLNPRTAYLLKLA